jgi:hypothetical protein
MLLCPAACPSNAGNRHGRYEKQVRPATASITAAMIRREVSWSLNLIAIRTGASQLLVESARWTAVLDDDLDLFGL